MEGEVAMVAAEDTDMEEVLVVPIVETIIIVVFRTRIEKSFSGGDINPDSKNHRINVNNDGVKGKREGIIIGIETLPLKNEENYEKIKELTAMH